jgi:hypothetical protein
VASTTTPHARGRRVVHPRSVSAPSGRAVHPRSRETSRGSVPGRPPWLPGLHLCAVLSRVDDLRAFGFDAAIEFPPHKFLGPENRPDTMPQFSNPRFAGTVIDYQRVVAQALSKRIPEDYVLYWGVVPGWDNTARRQDTPRILLGATPLELPEGPNTAYRPSATS